MAPSTYQDGVYVNGDYSEPMTHEHSYERNFDLDDPKAAMSMYSRIMHRHTQRQLDMATSSARRRSTETGASAGSTDEDPTALALAQSNSDSLRSVRSEE